MNIAVAVGDRPGSHEDGGELGGRISNRNSAGAGASDDIGPRLAPGTEFDLIRDFVAAAGAPARVRVPPGDDAAVLRLPEGEELVVATDLAVEGVHFRRAWMTWEAVGHRTVAAALSDLAAMAARPLGALLSVALPPELNRDVALSLAAGAGGCLRRSDAALLGGDISRSPGPVVLDAVAVGSTAHPVTRGGAGAGDELWVTGALGAAAAAVADLGRALEPDPRARRALERPTPRVREARWLARAAELHAMIDLSDGLAGDAAQMAAASGVGLEVELHLVPLAEPLLDYPRQEMARHLALTGGEDYELLLAVPAGTGEALSRPFEKRFGVILTRIGRVVDGRGVRWFAEGGEEVEVGPGWDHFAGEEG